MFLTLTPKQHQFLEFIMTDLSVHLHKAINIIVVIIYIGNSSYLCSNVTRDPNPFLLCKIRIVTFYFPKVIYSLIQCNILPSSSLKFFYLIVDIFLCIWTYRALNVLNLYFFKHLTWCLFLFTMDIYDLNYSLRYKNSSRISTRIGQRPIELSLRVTHK